MRPVPHEARPPFLSEEQCDRFAQVLREVLVQAFPPDEPAKLALALRGAYPYLLRHFILEMKPVQTPPHRSVPFPGCKSLCSTVLKVAETDPDVGIPQLLFLVTNIKPSNLHDVQQGRNVLDTVQNASIDEKRSGRLFDREELMPVLRDMKKPSDLKADLSARFDAAQQFAKNPE